MHRLRLTQNVTMTICAGEEFRDGFTHTVRLVVERVGCSYRRVGEETAQNAPASDVVMEVAGHDAQKQVARSSEALQRQLRFVFHRRALPLGQTFFHVQEPTSTGVATVYQQLLASAARPFLPYSKPFAPRPLV